MIPRHQPTYGLLDLAMSALPGGGGATIAQVEQRIADRVGVPFGVLFPSVRAGLATTLRILGEHTGQARNVLVPAYVCGVVHEAVHRAGWVPDFVDVSERGFLAAYDDEKVEGRVVVASEMFGHRLESSLGTARCRIYDWAMGVPCPAYGERLLGDDVGFFSFGIGKPLFLGRGGMAVTRSAIMAERLRQIRDQLPTAARSVFLRLAGQWGAYRSWVYGPLRWWMDRRLSKQPGSPDRAEVYSVPSGWDHEPKDRDFWTWPVGKTEMACLARMLVRIEGEQLERKAQEGLYRERLAGLGNQVLPPEGDLALSHFTILVPASRRNELRAELMRLGIDTGTFFGFPAHLSRRCFPLAYMRSLEVLNLPMGRRLGWSGARRVAEAVRRIWA